ncbi:MAG TPA: 16S rRNA (adenine(1518)-N(6)/adenine(1519)-N(6))-dimethyltransferase RsmA [Candidatus Omnitrophota bacterium]|nr:16S rRNA (adenine(1518)-N(6)/adenine(1519)-N(6))-dimethyltransferase RsmA [Candidatus Omnitrophota bacterium]HPS36156.1 16S rRNA (adenine(1518)-N(6)/adenine(1519)-N(6))-dimethyltransferase RsmA [Candidatus Omnitrophota bacterium]
MLSQIELLKKYDLKIRGHLGQHLLIDPNTIRKIVDSLDLQPGDRVFEIGPGLGAVTREVLERGFAVLAVETDRKFVEVLTAELLPEHGDRFKLVHADVLKCDLTKLITGAEAFSDGKKGVLPSVKVIGNLPYYISTPILFQLIDHAAVFSKAVLMLQKEVALRLTAKAGDEDYSRLSVTSRLCGEAEFLFDVSPSCFLPKPQVMSRVISFLFRPYPLEGRVKSLGFLLQVVRVAFAQRRKTLLSVLAKNLTPKVARENLEQALSKLGLSLNVRGEELSLEQFIVLTGMLERGAGHGNIPQA